MDTVLDGNAQQVDYLVVNDRTYFNSEEWGPGANDCWADITDDDELQLGAAARARPGVGADPGPCACPPTARTSTVVARLQGRPRGPAARACSRRSRRCRTTPRPQAVIEPHGHLIEVGIDVAGMWSKLPKEQKATLDKRVGYWAMTMKESPNGTSIAPPMHVFDPKVTPPSQCKR